VKTIGDSIMAVFMDERDALAAALDMQRAFEAYRGTREHAGGTALRLGVFSGPCYAVTANKILDYFGQSVNLAARLESVAKAGEIVVAQDLAERAQTGGWLAGAAVHEQFEVSLKGIAGATRAARIVTSS
jgi:class 3 adenylate cyclase